MGGMPDMTQYNASQKELADLLAQSYQPATGDSAADQATAQKPIGPSDASRARLSSLLSRPDFSDPSVQAARQAQMLTAQLKRGRAASFLAPGDSAAPPTVATKSLLGG